MTLLNKVLKVFVGDKSKKDIGEIMPILKEIKKVEPEIEKLSFDELRAKSVYFRQQIKEAQQELQDRIEALTQQADTTVEIDEKESIYAEIDKIKDQKYEIEKRILDQLLPEAFAVMKETAKRFVAHSEIEVTATPFEDRKSVV